MGVSHEMSVSGYQPSVQCLGSKPSALAPTHKHVLTLAVAGTGSIRASCRSSPHFSMAQASR